MYNRLSSLFLYIYFCIIFGFSIQFAEILLYVIIFFHHHHNKIKQAEYQAHDRQDNPSHRHSLISTIFWTMVKSQRQWNDRQRNRKEAKAAAQNRQDSQNHRGNCTTARFSPHIRRLGRIILILLRRSRRLKRHNGAAAWTKFLLIGYFCSAIWTSHGKHPFSPSMIFSFSRSHSLLLGSDAWYWRGAWKWQFRQSAVPWKPLNMDAGICR